MNNLRGPNSPSLAGLGGSGTLLSPAKASSNNNFISNGAIMNSNHSSSSMNPVQKPPRLNEYGGGGGGGYEGLTTNLLANLNNPDLINDTKGYGSHDNFAKLLMHHKQQELTVGAAPMNKTDSGEYSRAQGCDSLYPSGMWETNGAATTTTTGLDFNQEPYSLNHYSQQQQQLLSSINYSDKTPILGHGTSLSNCSAGSGGLSGGGSLGTMLINREGGTGATASAEFISRTLPRSQLHNNKAQLLHPHTSPVNSHHQHHQQPHQYQSSSLASSLVDASPVVATTSSASSGGYPADYGLPIVAGAEHEVQKSYREPLQQPPGMPTNAKTLRVWQRGGVPVLPPVTALKRALTSSRNSPDEGYQEGCGTDV